MTSEYQIHPDDYPELAVLKTFNKPDKEPDSVSNLELGLLVGISLFGLGVLFALGMLEPPAIEQVSQIIDTNITINPFK